MSINIPAETPDESTNPISVEEFERLHPAMLGAIRKAVREEPARTVIGTVGDDRRSHLSLSSIRTSSSTHLSAMVCKARTAAASNLLVEPANVLKFRRCPSRASSENDSHKAFQIPGICDFAMSRRFTPRAISVSSVLSVLHMAVYAGSTSFRNPSGCCSTSKNCSRYSAAFDTDSSPNCSARTSQMRDDTDFRRGPGGSPNAARHYTRKGGA